jgi:hypothetical protein
VLRTDAVELIEVKLSGADPEFLESSDTYEKPDDRIPLIGARAAVAAGVGLVLEIDDLRIPLPQSAGLALEKRVRSYSGV